MAEAATAGVDPAAVEGHNLSHDAQSDAHPSRRRRLHLREKVEDPWQRLRVDATDVSRTGPHPSRA